MAAVWTIKNTKYCISKSGKSNVIETIEAHVTDTDSDGKNPAGDTVGAALQTDDLSSFKAYADVSEADCVTWLKEALGSDRVTQIEKDLADRIALLKTPTHGNALPWVKD